MRSGLSTPTIASVRGDPLFSESSATRPSRGRSDGKRTEPATASGGYFPPPESNSVHAARQADLRLCSAKQNSRRPPSSAALRPLSQKLGGAGPVRLPSGDRREGRCCAWPTPRRSIIMTTDRDELEFSSLHASS